MVTNFDQKSMYFSKQTQPRSLFQFLVDSFLWQSNIIETLLVKYGKDFDNNTNDLLVRSYKCFCQNNESYGFGKIVSHLCKTLFEEKIIEDLREETFGYVLMRYAIRNNLDYICKFLSIPHKNKKKLNRLFEWTTSLRPCFSIILKNNNIVWEIHFDRLFYSRLYLRIMDKNNLQEFKDFVGLMNDVTTAEIYPIETVKLLQTKAKMISENIEFKDKIETQKLVDHFLENYDYLHSVWYIVLANHCKDKDSEMYEKLIAHTTEDDETDVKSQSEFFNDLNDIESVTVSNDKKERKEREESHSQTSNILTSIFYNGDDIVSCVLLDILLDALQSSPNGKKYVGLFENLSMQQLYKMIIKHHSNNETLFILWMTIVNKFYDQSNIEYKHHKSRIFSFKIVETIISCIKSGKKLKRDIFCDISHHLMDFHNKEWNLDTLVMFSSFSQILEKFQDDHEYVLPFLPITVEFTKLVDHRYLWCEQFAQTSLATICLPTTVDNLNNDFRKPSNIFVSVNMVSLLKKIICVHKFKFNDQRQREWLVDWLSILVDHNNTFLFKDFFVWLSRHLKNDDSMVAIANLIDCQVVKSFAMYNILQEYGYDIFTNERKSRQNETFHSFQQEKKRILCLKKILNYFTNKCSMKTSSNARNLIDFLFKNKEKFGYVSVSRKRKSIDIESILFTSWSHVFYNEIEFNDFCQRLHKIYQYGSKSYVLELNSKSGLYDYSWQEERLLKAVLFSNRSELTKLFQSQSLPLKLILPFFVQLFGICCRNGMTQYVSDKIAQKLEKKNSVKLRNDVSEQITNGILVCVSMNKIEDAKVVINKFQIKKSKLFHQLRSFGLESQSIDLLFNNNENENEKKNKDASIDNYDNDEKKKADLDSEESDNETQMKIWARATNKFKKRYIFEKEFANSVSTDQIVDSILNLYQEQGVAKNNIQLQNFLMDEILLNDKYFINPEYQYILRCKQQNIGYLSSDNNKIGIFCFHSLLRNQAMIHLFNPLMNQLNYQYNVGTKDIDNFDKITNAKQQSDVAIATTILSRTIDSGDEKNDADAQIIMKDELPADTSRYDSGGSIQLQLNQSFCSKYTNIKDILLIPNSDNQLPIECIVFGAYNEHYKEIIYKKIRNNNDDTIVDENDKQFCRNVYFVQYQTNKMKFRNII